MKFIFFSIFILLSSFSIFAQSEVQISKNQVFLTNAGMFVEYEGNLYEANNLNFCTNCNDGFYVVSIETERDPSRCELCGSHMRGNRCENQNCSQSGRYGPPEWMD